MHELYQAYFRLDRSPFNVTPDPSFLYLSASHREALAQLSYGIKARKGFIVLTGEVGTGKTTLIHTLLNDLNDVTHTALIFSTVLSAIDLLRYVCEEFKLMEPRQRREELHDYLVLLNEFLLEKYRLGENCVLIIDEAQNLSAEVLESIRMLSNFETSTDKLLQILLIGQPELAVRLNTPELRQLKQRITLRHYLQALTLKECQEYITNRLQIAGGNADIFTPTAVATVYSYSSGIPRLVNVLCDSAMLTSYAIGKSIIDTAIIREVAEDLSLTRDFGSTAARRPESVAPHKEVQRLNGTAREKEVAQAKIVQPRSKSAIVYNSKLVTSSNGTVATEFLKTVIDALTEAMGPMASIVVHERVPMLDVTADGVPREKLWLLIDSVSQEIFDESIRNEFRQNMSARIRQLHTTQRS
jgi:type II secretory pathway predicted ATPase ExeA